MATHKVYVYGTLRPGNTEEHLVPGVIYDLGGFPALVPPEGDTDARVVCEVREVDDEQLAAFDIYEGYREESPQNSLYTRERYNDGWIYVFVDREYLSSKKIVESGDWKQHMRDRKGNPDLELSPRM